MMAEKRMWGLQAATILAFCATITQAATTSYHIGNSLTWDSRPLAIEEHANANGQSHDVGVHIRCSSSLAGIWDNPEGTCVDPEVPYGKFSQALPGFEWTHVTLQLHPQSGVTLGEEVEMITNFISLTNENPANAGTTFWLHSAWPQQYVNYQEYWTRPFDGDPTAQARSYRSHVSATLEAAREANPAATINMMPVAEVWYELDIRMRAGLIPGFTDIDQFYSNKVHATGLGRFVAGMTTLAVMFDNDRTNLNLIPDLYYNCPNCDPAVVPALLDAIHDVVYTHPYTGLSLDSPPGDYDRNGTVGLEDFDYWKAHYGTTVAQPGAGADGNFDGRISAADYTVWQDHWYLPDGTYATAADVPEPSALLLALSAVVGLTIARRMDSTLGAANLRAGVPVPAGQSAW